MTEWLATQIRDFPCWLAPGIPFLFLLPSTLGHSLFMTAQASDSLFFCVIFSLPLPCHLCCYQWEGDWTATAAFAKDQPHCGSSCWCPGPSLCLWRVRLAVLNFIAYFLDVYGLWRKKWEPVSYSLAPVVSVTIFSGKGYAIEGEEVCNTLIILP